MNQEINMLGNSNEKKNKICDLLQSVSEKSIRESCDEFYFCHNKRHWYDQSQIEGSLYPLLGEKSPNKPIMLISGSPNLSDELKDMNEGMRDHDCCDKSIIYIHNSGCHFNASS